MSHLREDPDAACIDVALAGRLGAFELDAAFQAPMRGITALFGRSGSGKTSILRSIAGLQRLSGRIALGGEVWQDEKSFRPPHLRAVGYVFQEASLFPHLSVRDNLLYGRKRSGEGSIPLDDVVQLLGLSSLIDRGPAKLSGGERQRVAIGRALLSQPQLILMDEPLSGLDRTAKDEILPFFEALHAELSIPILLVSHELSEVERLADHLVALRDGRVVSSQPLNAALTDPAAPLGALREQASILPATVLRLEPDGLASLGVLGSEMLVVARGLRVGDRLRVRLGASDVSIARSRPAQTSILNLLPARIVGIDPLGEAEANVRLALGPTLDTVFLARLSRRSLNALDLKPGETVIAQIKGVSVLATR